MTMKLTCKHSKIEMIVRLTCVGPANELQIPKEDDARSKTKKWKLHIDRASSKQGSGIGIQHESPTREIIKQSFRLGFNALNNKAEYESMIVVYDSHGVSAPGRLLPSATQNWSQANFMENMKQKK